MADNDSHRGKYWLDFPQGRDNPETLDCLMEEAESILASLNVQGAIPEPCKAIIKKRIQQMAWQMGLETRPGVRNQP